MIASSSTSMSLLGTGLRALFFLKMPERPASANLGSIIFLTTLCIALHAILDVAFSTEATTFSADGLINAVATWSVFAVLVALLRWKSRPFDISHVVGSCTAASIFPLVAAGGVFALAIRAQDALPSHLAFLGSFLPLFAWLLVLLWQLVAYRRIGRAATVGMQRRLGVALSVVALLPMFIVPAKPIFTSASNTNAMLPTVWDALAYWRSASVDDQSASHVPARDYESVWDRQPDLISRSLAELAPSRAGITELYFVGAATYASQDVFKREVASARQIVDDRLGTQGRSIMLVNHWDTARATPLANGTNLGKVLLGLRKIMDPDKDVLMLFVTSHGNKQLISVNFPGFGFNDMTPDTLRKMLDDSGIKNRVIVLSACHSGSFIQALESADTLIITAAHADKSSFGCSNEREWTYFGDAFFNHALRKTVSLTDAFEQARQTVSEWEQQQGFGLLASEPQISLGVGIAAKIKEIEARLARVQQAQPARGQVRDLAADDAVFSTKSD